MNRANNDNANTTPALLNVQAVTDLNMQMLGAIRNVCQSGNDTSFLFSDRKGNSEWTEPRLKDAINVYANVNGKMAALRYLLNAFSDIAERIVSETRESLNGGHR